MKYPILLLFVFFCLSCSNNTQIKGKQNLDNQAQTIEENLQEVNHLLFDSVFCTDLLVNSKLISWALYSSKDKPIITIKENHFSVDTIQQEAHLVGKLTDARKYHGKKNRLYRFDVVFRDTTITNIDFELYEITKDCFGKEAEFPTSNFIKHGSSYSLPAVVGQRIYIGYSGDLYADIYEETETSRTYRSPRQFDSTSLRDFARYYDKDFPSKFFITNSSSKPYAKVEHWRSPNRLVLYNYRANTYFVMDYETLDLLDRDYIN
jgi:hypothetical protein